LSRANLKNKLKTYRQRRNKKLRGVLAFKENPTSAYLGSICKEVHTSTPVLRPIPHPQHVLFKLNMLACLFPLPASRKTYDSQGYRGQLAPLLGEAADRQRPTPTGARTYIIPGRTTWRVNNGPLQEYQAGHKRIELRGKGYPALKVDTVVWLPCGYAKVSHVGGFESAAQFTDFVHLGGLDEGYGCLQPADYGRYGISSEALDNQEVVWTALEFYDLRLA
jgi:hypothetical protein